MVFSPAGAQIRVPAGVTLDPVSPGRPFRLRKALQHSSSDGSAQRILEAMLLFHFPDQESADQYGEVDIWKADGMKTSLLFR